MRRLFKWLLLLGVLGAVGAGIAFASPRAFWQRWRGAPRYRTVEVSRGRVETVVNSTGTIKPIRSVAVGAFVSGPILEVYIDHNSSVHKGQLLARIDPRLLEANVLRDRATLDTQRAELKRIEALLEQAFNNKERALKLMKANKDYLSEVEMDQYKFTHLAFEAQYDLAKAQIAQAEASLKNTETNLEYTKIIAPVDGIVMDRKVDPGQTVAASFQTPELFIIAPEMDKRLHVFASVDEADIGLIQTAKEHDQPVRFTVAAYPGELFEGRIYQVRLNHTTTQNVVTYPVIIEAPNLKMKLTPGMTATISFPIEAKENVLRVPAAALRFFPQPAQIHPDDRHYLESDPNREQDSGARLSATDKAAAARNRHRRLVWVREGEWLRAVPVVLGLMDNHHAELLEGALTEGQALVTATESALAPPR